MLTFTFVFGDAAKKSTAELAEYAKYQPNEELVDWHRRFSMDEFSEIELAEAIDRYKAYLAHLESCIGTSPWLSGDTMGLADISCMVQWDRACLLNARKRVCLIWMSIPNLPPGFSKSGSDRATRKPSSPIGQNPGSKSGPLRTEILG